VKLEKNQRIADNQDDRCGPESKADPAAPTYFGTEFFHAAVSYDVGRSANRGNVAANIYTKSQGPNHDWQGQHGAGLGNIFQNNTHGKGKRNVIDNAAGITCAEEQESQKDIGIAAGDGNHAVSQEFNDVSFFQAADDDEQRDEEQENIDVDAMNDIVSLCPPQSMAMIAGINAASATEIFTPTACSRNVCDVSRMIATKNVVTLL